MQMNNARRRFVVFATVVAWSGCSRPVVTEEQAATATPPAESAGTASKPTAEGPTPAPQATSTSRETPGSATTEARGAAPPASGRQEAPSTTSSGRQEAPPAAAPGDSPGAAVATARGRSPISAKWEVSGAPTAGATFRLTAVVERRVRLTVPTSVEIRVPAGASLVSGEVKSVLAPNDKPTQDVLPIELRLGEIPSQDLVLVVEASGTGLGYHAEVPYRFGRAEAVRTPTRSGPELKVGKRRFGKPVQVPAKAGDDNE